jgi:hypothetical protein
MSDAMKTRISRISLLVFAMVMATSMLLLSVAGDYWPWYAMGGIFAGVPLVVGPSRYRLLGALAACLSVALIIRDCTAS